MEPKSALNPEALFATLADLVAINSVNPQYPDGAGEAALADYVGQFFHKNSIPFEFQTVFEGRPNVIARLEGAPGGPTLVLEAHMDTASGLGMKRDPFRPLRTGQRMYGRGTCDTKGGLAAMMHALKLLTDVRPRRVATVVLVAAVDEEYSFRGVVKFLEKAIKAQGAVVAEPTGLDTVIASKGVLRLRMRALGRTAHSSKPHLGINAVAKMAKVVAAMEEKFGAIFEKRRHPVLGCPTINVGLIRGGVQVTWAITVEIEGQSKPAVVAEWPLSGAGHYRLTLASLKSTAVCSPAKRGNRQLARLKD